MTHLERKKLFWYVKIWWRLYPSISSISSMFYYSLFLGVILHVKWFSNMPNIYHLLGFLEFFCDTYELRILFSKQIFGSAFQVYYRKNTGKHNKTHLCNDITLSLRLSEKLQTIRLYDGRIILIYFCDFILEFFKLSN